MAFRWRADAAGPSLNARLITVIFQGILTRIAEKPYIFVIFRGGGGGGRLDPRMSYGGVSYGVRRERSGSVVECLTRDRRAAGSSLTGVTALWSLSKTLYPSLVLVQPRKTRPA